MTTNKKDNKKKMTVSEALLELDKVAKDLKEGSNDILSSFLAEAVKKYINEEIGGEDEPKDDENDYTIEDGAAEEADADEAPASEGEEESEEGVEDPAAEEPASDEGEESLNEPEEGEGEEWSGMDDFKVGDDAYDLTAGENGDEKLVKVYKLLKDTDQVVVKSENGTTELKDNETGAEYVIKTGCEGEGCPVEEGEENEFEFEIGGDDAEAEGEKTNDEEDETVMEGKEQVYEIDLGYTDNYQAKDPIQGLGNSEPSKSGKSWHKGVPTGTEKPWAGKGNSKPFGEKGECNEEELLTDVSAADAAAGEEIPVEEGTNVTLPNRRKKSKSHSMQQKDYPKVAHHDSQNGDYKALEEKVARLQKENKEMREALPKIKAAFNEAVLVNCKLGRIVNLISENATTQNEKKDIIARFDQVKSIEQANSLYESVKRELTIAASTKKGAPVTEGKETVNESKNRVVETTVYQSNDIKSMIDLMNRMKNC